MPRIFARLMLLTVWIAVQPIHADVVNGKISVSSADHTVIGFLQLNAGTTHGIIVGSASTADTFQINTPVSSPFPILDLSVASHPYLGAHDSPVVVLGPNLPTAVYLQATSPQDANSESDIWSLSGNNITATWVNPGNVQTPALFVLNGQSIELTGDPAGTGLSAVSLTFVETTAGLACPASTGQVSVPYSSALVVTGGQPPFTFSQTSGSLPPPLMLNTSTGEITGTPTTAGPFSASFKVVDSFGSSATTPAAGCPILIAPNVCALGQGSWKNQPAAWPVVGLTLGGRAYTEAQLLTILSDPIRGDASLILAHQLIAALLSVANGSPSYPITSTLAAAQVELASVGPLPAGVDAASSLGQAMAANAAILENFNSDMFPSQQSCTGPK